MEARGADSSGVERIPLLSACTRPVIFFAGQPTTQRTPNARTGWIVDLGFINLVVPNDGWAAGKLAHCAIIAQSVSGRTVDRVT